MCLPFPYYSLRFYYICISKHYIVQLHSSKLYMNLIIMYIFLQLFTLQYFEIRSCYYSCNVIVPTVRQYSIVWQYHNLSNLKSIGIWIFPSLDFLFLLSLTVLLWTFLYMTPAACLQKLFRVNTLEWKCWVMVQVHLQS